MTDTAAARAIEQLSARAQALAGNLQGLTAQGRDDRALITATCGIGGRLVDIQFDPRARRLDTHELREAVLAAVQRAGSAAAEQVSATAAELSGDGFAGALGADVIRQARDQIGQYQRLVQEQLDTLAGLRASLQSQR
jgi:DNA-binding protein YbaB